MQEVKLFWVKLRRKTKKKKVGKSKKKMGKRNIKLGKMRQISKYQRIVNEKQSCGKTFLTMVATAATEIDVVME